MKHALVGLIFLFTGVCAQAGNAVIAKGEAKFRVGKVCGQAEKESGLREAQRHALEDAKKQCGHDLVVFIEAVEQTTHCHFVPWARNDLYNYYEIYAWFTGKFYCLE